jgi:hypothetical protein
MPQRTEEFPCRTKRVECESYRIEIFDADGGPRISTSCETREQAEKWAEMIVGVKPGIYSKITERRWTENVCIECGTELDVW